ncbi:hypothetical protein Fmac_032261 [Flemingia macrophylla]|uniref:Non-haem dioxygenase N-terminal domain-containing protein n=1 Tax=Flemingia macrophylla TaxID=520843 RepID=A0ABD1L4F8_9FABA
MIEFIWPANSLISLYAKAPDLGSVKRAFKEIWCLDAYLWTTLISTCAKLASVGHALQVFDEIPKRHVVEEGNPRVEVHGLPHSGWAKKLKEVYSSANSSEQGHHHADLYPASDDEIPTVDYSLLFSEEPIHRFLALENLRQACQEYGFFYLVNHKISDEVLDSVIKGFSGFCDPKTIDERKVYRKSGPSDKIRWDLNSSALENREYLKVVAHPQYHAPSNPSSLRKNLEEYHKAMRTIVVGLARAVSKTLGLEEDYIEKEFNLKSGFDILTNGEYKSHIHRVIVKNNEVQRISVVTLHGPALDKFISPGIEFVDGEHPQKYQGMTYKESLEANGGDEIDVESSLGKLVL